MKQYSRVSYAVRCQICAFLEINLSIPEIATRLGYNKSTIYREIKRNSFKNLSYQTDQAQRWSDKRRLRCRKKRLLKGDYLDLVVKKLKEDWSPQQISKRFKLENVPSVSHETIYKFMRRKPNRKYYRYYNRRGCSRYSQRRMRKDSQLSIHQRPEIVNQRKRFGDWERDSMIVSKDKLLVCTERKSRFTRIEPYQKFDAKMIGIKTLEMITPLGRPVRTITNDNGPEFRGDRDHGIPVYYCDPRKPQQRGTVENTIGILRKRLTLKTDLSKLTKNGLKKIEDALNLRPRKCLGYRTPYEVFFNTKVALVT